MRVRAWLVALFVSAISVASVQAVDISMGDFFFDPQVAVASSGDTVTWTNNGFAGHTTTSGDPGPNQGLVWGSATLFSGMSFSQTFDSPLDENYFCIPHQSFMFGHLYVDGEGVQCTMIPDDVTLSSGQAISFNAYVDNFGATETVTIQISGAAPNGASGTFVNVSLPVAGGAQLSNGVQVPIPAGFPAGEYTVTMTCSTSSGSDTDEDVYTRSADLHAPQLPLAPSLADVEVKLFDGDFVAFVD